jgi:hypothetical protein
MKLITATSSICFAAICLLSGCSSVSVTESRFSPRKNKLTTPPKIYVVPYTFADGSLRVDREGEKLREFENEVSADMTERLVMRLAKHIGPASALDPGAEKPSKDSWVVEGEFTRINQGSRALRSIIGFGLGGTKMEATTKVFALNGTEERELVVLIKTSGGSNAEPGAVVGGVFGAGPRAVLRAATSGVSADSRRTARMITAVLSEQLVADGAQLAGKPLRAKRPQE